jgi:hypothetical protein
MTAEILIELADLFIVESGRAVVEDDDEREASRLGDIAEVLLERARREMDRC